MKTFLNYYLPLWLSAILLITTSLVLVDLFQIQTAQAVGIAYDTVSNSGAFAQSSSLSWNHTCTGTNLLLVVGVVTSGTTPSSVKYNNVAMTLVTSQSGSGSGDLVLMYYLINPSTGTNSIAVAGLTNEVRAGGAVSLTGVNQSGQPDASGTVGNSSAPSKAVVSVADNSWYVDIAGIGLASGDTTFSSPSPGTQRVNTHNTVSSFGYSIAMQVYGPKTPAGSQTLSWSESIAAGSDYIVASFSPVVTASPATFPFMMF